MEGSAAQVDVPSYFLCPISMEIMRDPVTLSSGITYDRESIERWVFTDGHGECPMTKQQLGAADREPTPNHTLRRLIQGWCAVHAVERFTTPRAPVDAARVLSPQELQIARLAADGLSNRDIGHALYLSHRTIGSHLYKIFPKLGVASRGELRALLAQ